MQKALMFEFFSDPISLLAITIAAIAGFKLWQTFGDRSFPSPIQKEVPAQPTEVSTPLPAIAAQPTQAIWHGFAEEGSDTAQALNAIHQKDQSFTAGKFLNEAKILFEEISSAFAEKNLAKLEVSLDAQTLAEFKTEIARKTNAGLNAVFKLVSIGSAKIIAASLHQHHAEITVAFQAEAISAIKDSQEKVTAGSLTKIHQMRETWTFTRNLDAREKFWRLCETAG